VIAKIGEHLRGIVKPHERVTVFWRAALITEHMGYDAESVKFERGAQRGELGGVIPTPTD
jgi:hypothetical protein